MKVKIFLFLLTVCLLVPVLALPAFGAQDAQDKGWAVVSYTYDPDVQDQPGESGKLSYRADGVFYLHRYSTLTWDTQNAFLRVDGVLCEGESLYIKQAGSYDLTVTNKTTGESLSYKVEMLPVIKAGEQYLTFDESQGKFESEAILNFPALVCDNVSVVVLDEGTMHADKNFVSGTQITRFGKHTMRLVSKSREWRAEFVIAACTAAVRPAKVEDGKNYLEIRVGEFPGELSVTLDGVTPLAQGQVYELTKMGQHTLTATLDGEQIPAAALPNKGALCLQMSILLPESEITEPFVLHFSHWDATFLVDGKRVEGDYRIASAGEHVFVALDESGNPIENAFLVRAESMDPGISHTELTITFYNHHHLYAVLVAIPALALIGVAVCFFVKRRGIV